MQRWILKKEGNHEKVGCQLYLCLYTNDLCGASVSLDYGCVKYRTFCINELLDNNEFYQTIDYRAASEYAHIPEISFVNS